MGVKAVWLLTRAISERLRDESPDKPAVKFL